MPASSCTQLEGRKWQHDTAWLSVAITSEQLLLQSLLEVLDSAMRAEFKTFNFAALACMKEFVDELRQELKIQLSTKKASLKVVVSIRL